MGAAAPVWPGTEPRNIGCPRTSGIIPGRRVLYRQVNGRVRGAHRAAAACSREHRDGITRPQNDAPERRIARRPGPRISITSAMKCWGCARGVGARSNGSQRSDRSGGWDDCSAMPPE
jgi:hypothetical protein